MKKTTLFSLALAAGLAILPSLVDAQSKVTLTTTKAVGSEFCFATNPGKITVDWGDGKAVELSSTGEPIKGELKGQTVTISSNYLWFLDCSSNDLTGLTIDDGSNMKTLFCSNNNLVGLPMNSLASLETLDCSSNKIGFMTLTSLKNLRSLNCADNELTSLNLTGLSKLNTLICSGNSLGTLNVSAATGLQTLWCQNNSLKTLNLTSNSKLESVVCDDNQLSSVNVSTCTGIVDFWCDNNQLTTLNVSKSLGLQTLSCSNNQLTTLNIPAASVGSKTKAFYCDGNNLTFSSMHSIDNIENDVNMLYSPQNNFSLPVNKIKVGERLTLDGFSSNADGDNVSPDYVWKNGETELVSGNSGDYTGRSNFFIFNKPFESIRCEVTSYSYPGLTLTSEPLTVFDESTGIQDIMDAYGFSYITNSGTITMKSDKPYRVQIYTSDGKLVWTGTVVNEERVNLGHGLFLVNGVKISL